MLQEIITWTIVGGALFYSVFSVVRSIRKKSKSTVCEGCSGCDLRKEITKNLKKEGKTNCDQYHI